MNLETVLANTLAAQQSTSEEFEAVKFKLALQEILEKNLNSALKNSNNPIDGFSDTLDMITDLFKAYRLEKRLVAEIVKQQLSGEFSNVQS
jgi:uncharacterized coiled-coil protein SlyX